MQRSVAQLQNLAPASVWRHPGRGDTARPSSGWLRARQPRTGCWCCSPAHARSGWGRGGGGLVTWEAERHADLAGAAVSLGSPGVEGGAGGGAGRVLGEEPAVETPQTATCTQSQCHQTSVMGEEAD